MSEKSLGSYYYEVGYIDTYNSTMRLYYIGPILSSVAVNSATLVALDDDLRRCVFGDKILITHILHNKNIRLFHSTTGNELYYVHRTT